MTWVIQAGVIIKKTCAYMHQFVYFKSNGIYFRVALPEICYIEAVSKYVKIATTHKIHLAMTSMAALEKKLPANLFCRIHRSFIVSLQHISKFNSETLSIDGTTTELPIGKQYKGILQQRLFIICGEEKEINQSPIIEKDNLSHIEFAIRTS